MALGKVLFYSLLLLVLPEFCSLLINGRFVLAVYPFNGQVLYYLPSFLTLSRKSV